MGLSLLLAISTGVVLFTVAGARRTSTAWDRLATETNAHDALVIGQQFDLDLDAVARLPEVADWAPLAYVAGVTDIAGPFELTPLVSGDGGFLGRIDRPKVIEGRRPDPTRSDEIGITPPVAAKYDLQVGSTIKLRGFTTPQLVEVLSGREPSAPEGPEVTLRVVAIEVTANEGELVESTRSGDNLHLTPAFHQAYAGRIGMGPAVAVRLQRGNADQSSFELGVERIAAGRPVQLTTQADEGSQVRHSIQTQAQALRLFAAFAALAGALAVGQALSRQTFVEAGDHAVLRALGMTRRQLWAVAMVRTGVVGVSGAVGGVALAVAALPAWRSAREPSPGGPVEAMSTRTVPLAERFARLGFPPTAVTGVRFAVDRGRGRTAAPTRSAILSVAFSVAALTTALTFGASLDHLFSTPRLYGWNWDVVVGNPYTTDLSERLVPALRTAREVDGFSGVRAAFLDIGGVRTQGYGFDTLRGDVLPPVVEGRPPRQPDEVVLGANILRDLDRGVGESVEVRVGDKVATLRIVGKGVFAQLSFFENEALGKGALLTGDGLRALVPEAQQNVFPLHWADGVDREAAQRAFRDALGDDIVIDEAEAPLEIADFGRVDGMPAVLSALVALMAVASLAHALVTTVRRRRRDLTILKTLGFVRRQVSSTVAWQATTMAVLALAVGLPLGIAVGHRVWRIFATDLGIVAEPVVPLVGAAITVPAAILLANLVATLPGRIAARTRPALGRGWE